MGTQKSAGDRWYVATEDLYSSGRVDKQHKNTQEVAVVWIFPRHLQDPYNVS
jgi:hypothetical protein